MNSNQSPLIQTHRFPPIAQLVEHSFTHSFSDADFLRDLIDENRRESAEPDLCPYRSDELEEEYSDLVRQLPD